jgi:hypothetical protein
VSLFAAGFFLVVFFALAIVVSSGPIRRAQGQQRFLSGSYPLEETTA